MAVVKRTDDGRWQTESSGVFDRLLDAMRAGAGPRVKDPEAERRWREREARAAARRPCLLCGAQNRFCTC